MRIALVLFSLSFAFSAQAVTRYNQSVSAQTSVNISAATHGISCVSGAKMGVRYVNQYSVVEDRAGSMSSDSSCNLTFSFSPAFTGTIKLAGPFSITSSSGDFEVDSSTNSILVLCPNCGSTAAVRGSGYGIMERSYQFNLNYPSGASGSVYVFLQGKKVIFATSNGVGGGCDNAVNSDCDVQTYVGGVPYGAVGIFSFTFNGSGVWTGSTDLRSF